MVKRLAAVSTGAAMLGATLTGALAADLSSYPEPFVNVAGKQFDYLIVLGSGAAGEGAAKDTAGALDIASGLAAVPIAQAGSSKTVSVTGGVSEDVPLTLNIAANNQLDNSLDDGDIETLFDGEITFQSTNYDTSEVLFLNLNKNISIQTSLSSSDDDYGSGVVMEIEKGALQYIYQFDESILVNKTTSSDPLDIDFLGQRLRVTDVNSATKITAQVGQEYFLNSGESVSVGGKAIKLERVGSNGDILINVDGVTETLTNGATRTVNGLEVNNDAQFYDSNNQAASAANLVVGIDAVETIQDGGSYFGGDDTCSDNSPSDPDCWKFVVKTMNTEGTTTITNTAADGVSYGTTGPVLGLKNDFALNDDKDNPPKIGECITFPNDFLSVCFDSVTTDDADNLQLTIEKDTGFDSETTEAGLRTALFGSPTAAILIQSSVSDSLVIDVDGTNFLPNQTQSSDLKTEKIWLAAYNESVSAIYYEDTNGVTQLAGFAENYTEANFGYIDFNKIKGTSGTSIILKMGVNGEGGTVDGDSAANSSGGYINFTLEPADADLTANTDTIFTNWTLSQDDISSLGANADSADAAEVQREGTSLGTKDEDHRSTFGIIVKDPKSNGASDRARLEIPTDMMQANVVVKGSAASVTAGGGSTTVVAAVDTAPSPVIDTDVVSKTSDNLILVGGPAVNRMSAEFMGLTYPAFGADSGLEEGEAIISLKANGEKVAMIVAGWAADDTQRAARILKGYSAYKTSLKGSEISVKGTTANPTIISGTTTA